MARSRTAELEGSGSATATTVVPSEAICATGSTPSTELAHAAGKENRTACPPPHAGATTPGVARTGGNETANAARRRGAALVRPLATQPAPAARSTTTHASAVRRDQPVARLGVPDPGTRTVRFYRGAR
jgi:hypothetical protein